MCWTSCTYRGLRGVHSQRCLAGFAPAQRQLSWVLQRKGRRAARLQTQALTQTDHQLVGMRELRPAPQSLQ